MATPHSPSALAPPRRSPAVTVCLAVSGLGLWLGLFQATALLVPQVPIYESLRVRLPPPAETLVPVVRWLNGYWWAVLLGLALLAPVLVLVTWAARHWVRSGVWGWAWG